MATLKNNKAAGIDDVLVEQLNNLGPNTHMTACKSQQMLHSEQYPKNMEEIKDHRHIKTRERICDT